MFKSIHHVDKSTCQLEKKRNKMAHDEDDISKKGKYVRVFLCIFALLFCALIVAGLVILLVLIIPRGIDIKILTVTPMLMNVTYCPSPANDACCRSQGQC